MSTSNDPASETNFETVNDDEDTRDRVDGIVGGGVAGLPGGASDAGHENDDAPASESDDDSSNTES